MQKVSQQLSGIGDSPPPPPVDELIETPGGFVETLPPTEHGRVQPNVRKLVANADIVAVRRKGETHPNGSHSVKGGLARVPPPYV